jgi:hypothetical protein
VERLHTGRLKGADVHKHILALLGGDKAIPPLEVEPFQVPTIAVLSRSRRPGIQIGLESNSLLLDRSWTGSA